MKKTDMFLKKDSTGAQAGACLGGALTVAVENIVLSKETHMVMHQQLIKFQYDLLVRLVEGEDIMVLVKDVKNFLEVFYEAIDAGDRPRIPCGGAHLGINVNDICNLRCRHCYYSSTHKEVRADDRKNLNPSEFARIVDEAIDAGFERFSIMGKEPMFSRDNTRVVLETIEKRKIVKPNLKSIMLTNATLLEERDIEWLGRIDFEYIGVSFDGFEGQHDAIRGVGSYAKAKEGLRILKKSGIKNVVVMFTAMPQNVDSLSNLMADIADEGITNLSIGFCFENGPYSRAIVPSPDDFEKTINTLVNGPRCFRSVACLIGNENPSLLAYAFHSGKYLKLDTIGVTKTAVPQLIQVISESPLVEIGYNFLPTNYLTAMRLDCDGRMMDVCDALRSDQPTTFGNTKKTSIFDLYLKARELWALYTEKYLRAMQKELVKNEA